MSSVLDKYDLSTVCGAADFKILRPMLRRIPKQLNALHFRAADNEIEKSRQILEKMEHNAEKSDDETMMNEICLVRIYVKLWKSY